MRHSRGRRCGTCSFARFATATTPTVRRQLHTVIDDRVSDGIPELVERRALYQEVLHQVDVTQARERVDGGARSRLQPHFAATWFDSALKALGGRVRRRAGWAARNHARAGRVRSAARQGGGPLLRHRYEAVTFDPHPLTSAPRETTPEVLGPGHPLLDAVADAIQARFDTVLRDGVALVDPRGAGTAPRLFIAVSHEVTDGHATPHSLSKRVSFVGVARGRFLHGRRTCVPRLQAPG